MTSGKKLSRPFYLRPTITVAQELLGKRLVRKTGRATLIGKIVEVEAYLGEKDPASHAYRGLTRRNEVMFQEGGHLYVYFTYGMHYCCNVVTGKEGTAGAVLIRAVEPIKGIGAMRKNRAFTTDETDYRILTNGPAKLCQAFGIGRKENGTDLRGDALYLTEGEKISSSSIIATTRIGIKNAVEKKWRFYVKGNPFVSKKGSQTLV